MNLNELTAEDDTEASAFEQCKINNRAKAHSEEHNDDKSYAEMDRKLFLSEGGWYVIANISTNAVNIVLPTITCNYGKTQTIFSITQGTLLLTIFWFLLACATFLFWMEKRLNQPIFYETLHT